MSARTATTIDHLADRHLAATFAHDPVIATMLGDSRHDDAMPALDPDWYAERSAQRRGVLRELDAAEPVDEQDRITAAALREAIESAEALRDLGVEESELNVVDSPTQRLRMVFDIMPTASEQDWARVVTRLVALPAAVTGHQAALRHAAAQGHVAARRQVLAVAAQAEAAADGFFPDLGHAADGAAVPEALRGDLDRAAREAASAYRGLAEFLRTHLLPEAIDQDGVGREIHAASSRFHLGARVDPEETYEWGLAEAARLAAALGRTAERISPGAGLAEVVALLEADPARAVEGEAAFRDWLQRTSDAAVAALADVHFDIPEPLRRLDCRTAPTHDGGIYYIGPSDDLVTRAGSMWWSVPLGITHFPTWHARTTVYHEGVPGHHLQIAQTMYRREQLNRWRRTWINNGHCEGWALYAEQLMADLGFLDDPADLLGMLDAQSLRAARVVIDFGVHCGLPAPAEVGGGTWDYEKAWQFLRAHARSDEKTLRFELDRYLGWPGQAPCYAVGQRLWLQLRDDVRAREGDGFDLKSFHRRALDLGSVGLDVLREAVLGGYA